MSKQKLGLGMSNDEKRIEELEYIIAGIMHSVDKWLEGDEFMEDEVNRAATMREKVLRIIEEKDKEIARLEKELELSNRLLKMETEAAQLLIDTVRRDGYL